MDDLNKRGIPPVTEEEEELQGPVYQGKHAKRQSFVSKLLNLLMGKHADGTKKKAVYPTKKQTVFRYVTVVVAFLGIAGLAAIAYQGPKISKEGGFRFELFEDAFSGNSEEDRSYDRKATAENAFAYRIKEDGTVAISGYVGSESKVVVPREIDGKAVTEVSPGAFMQKNISSITLPKGVTTVGKSAFYECEILFEAILPDTVIHLGDGAFYNCETLKRITVPAGVTEIGTSTFEGCTSMMQVILPEGITKIGQNAFADCTFSTITLPASLKSTEKGAFRNCKSLTQILFFDGFESLGAESFSGCSALRSVQLGSTVSVLGDRAFEKCTALAEFLGGEGLTTIGEQCFDGAHIVGKPNYQMILGDGILVKYFGSEPHVSVEDSVKVIGSGAFEENTSLQTVTLPPAIIRDRAFKNCTALTQVVLPQTVTQIGKEAFSGCVNLSFMQLPASLTDLGEGAFAHCAALKGIALPPTLKYVPANAFARCTSLIEVKFNGQTEIGAGAFADCAGLTSVSLTASMQKVGDFAFADCSGLKTVKLGSNLKYIGENAFWKIGATSAHLPDTLTYIADSAFSDCPFLKALYATRGTYGHTWAANHGL
ncbi:MAG: leucine-rich repeat domain-containing protein [Clostridia bacterium]|nr:leucine-rich repeat domain-containing protein [Clostridia bacterium]